MDTPAVTYTMTDECLWLELQTESPVMDNIHFHNHAVRLACLLFQDFEGDMYPHQDEWSTFPHQCRLR